MRTEDALLLKDGRDAAVRGARRRRRSPGTAAAAFRLGRRDAAAASTAAAPRAPTSIGASSAGVAAASATACACSGRMDRDPVSPSPVTCHTPTMPTPKVASSRNSCGARSIVRARRRAGARRLAAGAHRTNNGQGDRAAESRRAMRVVGWKIGAEGRKLYSGTALYTEQGRLCAIGHCTWILLRN